MRKPWWFLCVVLCMLILIGCQGEEAQIQESITTASETLMTTQDPTESTDGGDSEEESQMAQIQEKLYQESALCAVAYVGYNGGSFAEIQEGFVTDGLLEVLPILSEIKEENLISAEGSELYLVIPREDVAISVFEQLFDEITADLTYGKALYTGFEPEALLLRGNISDIFPNLAILIEGQGGETLEYSPSLNLMDGTLYVETSLICDLTPYEALGIVAEPIVGDEDDRIGMWFTEALNTAGDTMALELTLDYEGNATYAYGAPDGECYEFFSGSWYEEDDLIILDLYGGAVSYDGEAESYDFHAQFRWEYADGKLTLYHVDGMGLLYGLEGGTFEFYSSNRASLIGLWSTSDYDSVTDSYIYFDLELLGDDRCSVLIHNGEGVTYAAYEGTWNVEAGVLNFNALIFSGNNYLKSMNQELGGYYRASFDTDGWLTLYYIDGDTLTEYMSEVGLEIFEPTVSYG
ncbi:MAG: hypothetical protein E7434_05920 [Ruminococcaceae bacterium]|nr:hypothetical protein [Oscillospiraceae bacterium]